MSQELTYPMGEPPAPGEAREVRPGLYWLRMPMPFALTHINLWAIADGAGWAIVDTGLQTTETTAAWRQLLAPEGPLGGKPVTRVFVTHMHPDHVGMAGWLTRRYECALWMSRLEYLTCRTLVADTGREAPADGVRFYRAAGWTDAALDNYRARFGGFGKMIHALPDSFQRIEDGQRIRIGDHEWEVVKGSGHSPEHACLYCRDLDVLISGDQVLPRITSNVSVFPTEPQADPLSDWLATLALLHERVADTVLVLPAHNEPFIGLHARLDTMANGVQTDLARLRELLKEPQRVVDTFGALFKRPITGEGQLLGLATGESIAHVNHLVRRGEAVLDKVDDAGAAWYRAR